MGHLCLHNVTEHNLGLEAGKESSALSPSFLICVTLGRQFPDVPCKTPFPYLSNGDDNILEVNCEQN